MWYDFDFFYFFVGVVYGCVVIVEDCYVFDVGVVCFGGSYGNFYLYLCVGIIVVGECWCNFVVLVVGGYVRCGYFFV